MAGMTTRRRQRAQRLDEDDGPVMIERRRSRHGNYYPEIPPEPEPTPVPVQPEPVPVPPVWNEQTALDYIKELASVQPYMATAVWSPVNGSPNWSSSYSISLNDVIGSYKGGSLAQTPNGDTYSYPATIEGGYDPTYQAAQAAMKAADDAAWNQATGFPGAFPGVGIIDAKTKECGHTYTEGLGGGKFKFNKKRSGGTAVEKVRCVTCGLEFSKERKF